MLLKNNPSPFFEQQFWLYLYGAIAAAAYWLFFSRETIITFGAYHTKLQNTMDVLSNLDPTNSMIVLGAILTASAGGIAIAGILKVLDNLYKILSAAIATIVTGYMCQTLFPNDFALSVYFTLGTCIVMYSTYIYAKN